MVQGAETMTTISTLAKYKVIDVHTGTNHTPTPAHTLLKYVCFDFATRKIAIKVLIFTYFQYFRCHPTPPEVVFFPMLLLKLCEEGISI